MMDEISNKAKSVQSGIESLASKISGNSVDEANPESAVTRSGMNLFASFFNGLGVGLLLGLLLGLAVSPVVSAIIGTLSSLLVVLLGLNENYLNPAKSIRIGSFGLFCVIGIVSGMYIRSHNTLAPSLKSLYAEYRAMGFSDQEARNFIAYQEFELIPENWIKVDSSQSAGPQLAEPGEQKLLASGENISAKRRKSVLFSSEVDAGKCDILESSSEKMPFSEVKMNFMVAGGTWKELATGLDPTLPELVRIKALLLLRDIFCASEGSGTILINCKTLPDINSQTSLEVIRTSLSGSGEIWSQIVLNVDRKIDPGYQKQLYLSYLKILCHD